MFGMDPIELFKVLNSVSPTAIVALLAYVIFILVKNKKEVAEVKNNHLHDLPEMLELLRSIDATLTRHERLANEMSGNIIYIKARINGKG